MASVNDIKAKIKEIEKLRSKAIDEKKKLDAKIKEYGDKIDNLQMQVNNAEITMAVKALNEYDGGNGKVTISELVELIRSNPQGVNALMDKKLSGSKKSAEVEEDIVADDATDDTPIPDVEEE